MPPAQRALGTRFRASFLPDFRPRRRENDGMRWTNVTIADMGAPEAVHRAYVDPNDRWNGWLCPWFEFDEVESMNEWLPKTSGEILDYDGETDAFICTNGAEDLEVFVGKDIDGMHLYPIGNGSWIWMEA